MSSDTYFEHVRQDVIRQVPLSALRILDVGCASGQTGRYLKEYRSNPIEVVGVEYSEPIGALAREHLDQVYIGNVEEIDLSFQDGYFDCILYADVLEHLVDPWAVLQKHARLLSDDGCMIASIPNIAYYKVISMLKQNKWEYKDAGIMDRTHLRFFTYPSMVELFDQAGLHATMVDRIMGGSKLMRMMPPRWSNRYVQQYILRAVKKNN